MLQKLNFRQENPGLKIILKYLTLMLLLLAIGGFTSCKDFKYNKGFVVFFTGMVTIERGGKPPVQIQLKEKIQDNDIIRTGEKSCLVLQSTDGITVRFEQNTEAQIISFNNISKKIINLNQGEILSSIFNLNLGEEYSVKTITTIASVRGTRFLMTFNGEDSVVAVGKGNVVVKRIADSVKEKSVGEGFTAVAAGKKDTVDLRKINRVETLELSKFNKTPFVNEIEKKTPEELKELFKETVKCDEQINYEIKETTGLTFDEMRARYGRIDVLYLYNGTEVEGVIAMRGAVYKMVTRKGIVMVDSKDIKRTETRR